MHGLHSRYRFPDHLLRRTSISTLPSNLSLQEFALTFSKVKVSNIEERRISLLSSTRLYFTPADSPIISSNLIFSFEFSNVSTIRISFLFEPTLLSFLFLSFVFSISRKILRSPRERPREIRSFRYQISMVSREILSSTRTHYFRKSRHTFSWLSSTLILSLSFSLCLTLPSTYSPFSCIRHKSLSGRGKLGEAASLSGKMRPNPFGSALVSPFPARFRYTISVSSRGRRNLWMKSPKSQDSEARL